MGLAKWPCHMANGNLASCRNTQKQELSPQIEISHDQSYGSRGVMYQFSSGLKFGLLNAL